jgi:hypothetical protein
MTTNEIYTVKLTKLQAEFLDDLACCSESYTEALDLGVRVEGLKLIIPTPAAGPLATAIGIRADLADEGENGQNIGERRSILGLAKKVSRVPGASKANPLQPADFLPRS